ncbi:MAG: T9SS type A sorting domain-containing protein [Sphingobacteriales bacterium]|nr:MAG: T9SS type A sorting domain-containing protein [Sphingobacteriales bacterium]
MKVRLSQKNTQKQKLQMRHRLMLVAAVSSITGLVVALFIFFNIGNVRNAFAATTTYYSRTDGTFHAQSTWSTSSHTGPAASSFPGVGDIAIIKHAVKLNQDLTIGNGSSGSVTILAGGSLIENGSRTISFVAGGSSTLTNNGTLEINKVNMWSGTNAGKLINNGTATIKTSFLLQSYTQITNNKTLNLLGNVELQGAGLINNLGATINLSSTIYLKGSPTSKLENYGTINSTSTDEKALYVENGELYNYSTGIINATNGGFFNNGDNKSVNNNLFKVKNFFSYNNGSFTNSDTLLISGNVTTELRLTNLTGGYVKINGNYRQNTTNYTDNSGFVDIAGNFDNYGVIKGSAGGFSIAGISTNWWNGTISGTVDICDKSKTIPTNYVDVNNNTSPTSIASSATKCSYGKTTPLPVSLISWEATPKTDYVKLYWATATEINNDYFTIERSSDGKNFEKLTTIKGAGNANTQLKYGYDDRDPLPGTSYYRLKQTDFNGQFEIFAVKPVQIAYAQIDNVGPNPFTNNITMNYNMLKEAPVTIQLVNASGMVVYETNERASRGPNTFTINNQQNLTKGMYILRLNCEGLPVNYKLIKS